MTHTRPDRSIRSEWPRIAALAGLTVVGVYLCYLLVAPFLPGVTWAVALALVGLPLHRRIARVVKNPNWAAGLSTAIVVLVIAIPVALVAAQLAAETTRAADTVREQTSDGKWREVVARVPYLGEWIAQLEAAEIEARVRELIGQLAARTLGFVQGALGGLVQALVAVFVLFFCFHDRHHLLAGVRSLIPLAPDGSDRIIGRAEDAIHATVYGTLLTSVLQAATGGLMFWALGLPAPVLWGVVMFVLSVLPFVGAFLVWLPAAVYLVTVDRWGAAIALVTWGVLMGGPVCNYLYACVAGDRMRMHPVPTLLAFIGGLAVFGVSGMVLGPCVLVVTVALIDVWRHRASDGIPVAARSEGVPKTASPAPT
ncbi:MAG: AI-2E family transporter [Planctomycetia bacterium]|nr:AI-2E family transporter [Planctomycetia bacterium]